MKDSFGPFGAAIWFILLVGLAIFMIALAASYAVVRIVISKINWNKPIFPNLRIAR